MPLSTWILADKLVHVDCHSPFYVIADVATELSQKCCEALVDAGAVGTLLKLIRSVSRSVPDQQVLKHALSTLRNLARYPHLTEILVGNNGCVETVFLEFLK